MLWHCHIENQQATREVDPIIMTKRQIGASANNLKIEDRCGSRIASDHLRCRWVADVEDKQTIRPVLVLILPLISFEAQIGACTSNFNMCDSRTKPYIISGHTISPHKGWLLRVVNIDNLKLHSPCKVGQIANQFQIAYTTSSSID